MAAVVMMGHVYAMITTMDWTAQVNQYFCCFIMNSFKNVILLHSKFEVNLTASIIFHLL